MGTVSVDQSHIARVRAAQKREKAKATKRSPKWPAARRKHLKAQPACGACGSRQGLQVHHVVPFHVDPKRELDPTNLVTLCEAVGGLECHEFFGHGADFKCHVPDVREIAAALMADRTKLEVLRHRAKTTRKT
jgi:formate dehydrogenase assembly factor FdhD